MVFIGRFLGHFMRGSYRNDTHGRACRFLDKEQKYILKVHLKTKSLKTQKILKI